MTKRQLFISVLFLVVLVLTFVVQQEFFSNIINRLDIMYIFHFIFSIGICYVLFFLSKKEKHSTSIGLYYMATFLLKATLFFVLFGGAIFNKVSLTNQQALSMLLPLFLSITFEVVFLINILSQNGTVKKN